MLASGFDARLSGMNGVDAASERSVRYRVRRYPDRTPRRLVVSEHYFARIYAGNLDKPA